jgi:hypothetical protein
METAVTAAREPALAVYRIAASKPRVLPSAPAKLVAAMRDAAASGELVLAVTHSATGRVYQFPLGLEDIGVGTPVSSLVATKGTTGIAVPATRSVTTAAALVPHHPLEGLKPLSDGTQTQTNQTTWLHHAFAFEAQGGGGGGGGTINPPFGGDATKPSFTLELVRRQQGHYRVALGASVRDPRAERMDAELSGWPSTNAPASSSSSVQTVEVGLYDAKMLRKRIQPSSPIAPAVPAPWCSVTLSSERLTEPTVSSSGSLLQQSANCALRHEFIFAVECSGAEAASDRQFSGAMQEVLEHMVALDVTTFTSPSTSDAPGIWTAYPILSPETADGTATVAALARAMDATHAQQQSLVAAARRVYGELLKSSLRAMPATSTPTKATWVAGFTATPQPLPLLPNDKGSASFVAVRLSSDQRQSFADWKAGPVDDQQGGGDNADDVAKGERTITSRVAGVAMVCPDNMQWQRGGQGSSASIAVTVKLWRKIFPPFVP